MQTKSSYLGLLAIITALTVLLVPLVASAQTVTVPNCAITLLGYKQAGGGSVAVKLDDLDDGTYGGVVFDDERAFNLHPDLGNAGYATLLTAVSLGKTIKVRIASATAQAGSIITDIWLNQ